MKDLESNQEVIEAVLRQSKGRGRYSCVLIREAILGFYNTHKLLPLGMTVDMQCVVNWAQKQAIGVVKLVSRFTRLMRGAKGSKNKALNALKDKLLDVVEPRLEGGARRICPEDFTPLDRSGEVPKGQGGEDGGEEEEDGDEEAEDAFSAFESLSELSMEAPLRSRFS